MSTLAVRLFFAASVFVSLAGGVGAKPLKVVYSYWFAVVPLQIAEREGFWAKRGLEVEVKGFATGQEVEAALATGACDVGYDMLGSLLDLAQKGAPILVVGETDWSHGGDKLLVRAGHTLAEYKGQPLVIYQRSSGPLLFLRAALKREKLVMGDFKIVEIAEDEKAKAAFADGRVNVILSYDPIAQQITMAGATAVASTADFPGVMPEGFGARRELATPEGDAQLEKFFAGWFEAVRYLQDPAHREDVARIASERTFAGTQAITPDDVIAYEKTTPVHSSAKAIKRNNLKADSVGDFIASIQVLWHQQGLPPAKVPMSETYHLGPIQAAARADMAQGK